MTTVNQSLGRVIRHINDYGALNCINESYKNFEKYFSLWIREQYQINKKIIISNINEFFTEQRKKFNNINPNNNLIYMHIDSKRSGFIPLLIMINLFYIKNLIKNIKKIIV